MASDVAIDQNLQVPLLEHSNKLLQYACNDKDKKARFSDVALSSGNRYFYVHRLVLAAYSPHFATLLSKYTTHKPGTSSQSLMLKVDFVKENILALLLDFMYKGYLEVNAVDLHELLNGARMLRIDAAVSIIQGLIQARPVIPEKMIKQEIIDDEPEEEDSVVDPSMEGENTENTVAENDSELPSTMKILKMTTGEEGETTIEMEVDEIDQEIVAENESELQATSSTTEKVLPVKPNLSFTNISDPDSVVVRYLAVAARALKFMETDRDGDTEILNCTLCGHSISSRVRAITAARFHLTKFHKTELLLAIAEDADFDAAETSRNPKRKSGTVIMEDSEIHPTDNHPKRKLSPIWTYFQLSEQQQDGRQMAKCLICNTMVSRPGSTTSCMLNHMSTHHKDIDKSSYTIEAATKRKRQWKLKRVKQEVVDDLEEGNEGSTPKSRRKGKRAKYSLATLMDAFFTLLSYDDNSDVLEIYPPNVAFGETKPMKRSVVWKYYIKDAENKKATCRICEKTETLSGGSTGALRSHIKGQHRDVVIEENREICEAAIEAYGEDSKQGSPRKKVKQEPEAAGDGVFEDSPWAVKTKKALLKSFFSTVHKDTESGAKRSAVWKYFVVSPESFPDGKKRASCTLCNKTMQIWDASTTNMKFHLEKHHAETIIEEQQEQLGLKFEGLESDDEQDKDSAALKHNLQAEAMLLAWLDTPYSETDENTSETVERLRIWKYFDVVEENKYKCNLCDVQFECLSGVALISLIILLRKHLKENHPEKARPDLRGLNCDLHVRAASHLVRYKEDAPTEEDLGEKYWVEDEYVCDHCDLRTQSTVIMRCHVMAFKDEYLCCPVCNVGFRNPKAMKVHIQKNHKDFRMLTCLDERCNSKFVDEKTRKAHWEEKHRGHIVYKCTAKNCAFMTNYKRDLVTHMGSEHKVVNHVCHICGKVLATKNCLENHVKNLHSGEVFQCDECGYAASNKRMLQSHMRTSHYKNLDGTRAEPFRCDQCATYTTFFKPLLRTHINQVHKNEKNHKCPHCDFRSATQYSVKVHILRHHAKSHAYSCNKCGWSCNLKGDILKHLRKKHGQVTYKCKYCASGFRSRPDLNRHLTTHSDYSGVGILYECPHCQYTNYRRSRMGDHIQRSHGMAEKAEFLRANPQYGAYTFKKNKEKVTDVVYDEELMNSYTFDPNAVVTAADVTRFPVQHVVHDAGRLEDPVVETWAGGEEVVTAAATENQSAVTQIETTTAVTTTAGGTAENVQTLELQPDQIAQILSNQGGVLKLDDGTTISGANSEQVVYYMHVP